MFLNHYFFNAYDSIGIRAYLHDRGLIQYADKLEAGEKKISQSLLV